MTPDGPARDRWAVTTLLRYFNARTGRWRTPTGEAWQPALAIEAVLSSFERTRDVAALNVVEKSFARYRGRRSRFFDDPGWYLNAWLRGYDATGDPKYLTEAEALFEAITAGWDERCGGGLWWNVDRTYKNAITNELFLLAAARLYRRTGVRRYRDWAVRAWAWFDGSGLVNDDGLVNDGLDGECRNNGQTTWTYNQGVVLSGLVELWRITGETALLATAHRIADAAIATLSTVDGVLRESTEPDPGNADVHLFKGILVQHLARLYRADPAARPAYAAFLRANADAAWARARRRGVGLGWFNATGTVNGATHTSASLLFAEVALLERAGTETVRAPVSAAVRYPADASGTIAVPVAPGRSYTLTFVYAAGCGDAYRRVEIDGVVCADALRCTGTGGWGRLSTVSLDVALTAGTHTVAVRRGRGRLRLDSLLVRSGDE